MEEPQIPRVHFIRSVRLVSAYQTGKLKSGLGGWLRVGAMHENAFCISMKISDPMQHWAREEQRLQGLLDTSCRTKATPAPSSKAESDRARHLTSSSDLWKHTHEHIPLYYTQLN